MLQSLLVSAQENHHGDTCPEHDADEHSMMGKLQEAHIYNETRGRADPVAFIVHVIACTL